MKRQGEDQGSKKKKFPDPVRKKGEKEETKSVYNTRGAETRDRQAIRMALSCRKRLVGGKEKREREEKGEKANALSMAGAREERRRWLWCLVRERERGGSQLRERKRRELLLGEESEKKGKE
ncbi:hypothetical protein TIFTF001_006161 [Ficus carica]|uniref:Uncharacterized protein n=1 Tax=Ficus carica TaxID=3494 RepID=A0AA87ZQH4_FICCA|nr:hypothetical protein TIFTF001_006161 [Ficus carica]